MKSIRKTIPNIYFLILGILFCFFALGHASFGYNNVLNFSMASELDHAVKTAIFYSWHTPTAENLIFGIGFVLMAFYKNQVRISLVAFLILAVNIARLLVYLGSIYVLSPNQLHDTVPTIIIMILVFALLAAGIQKSKAS